MVNKHSIAGTSEIFMLEVYILMNTVTMLLIVFSQNAHK